MMQKTTIIAVCIGDKYSMLLGYSSLNAVVCRSAMILIVGVFAVAQCCCLGQCHLRSRILDIPV